MGLTATYGSVHEYWAGPVYGSDQLERVDTLGRGDAFPKAKEKKYEDLREQ